MSENCLFCNIISGTVPADKVDENDLALAFRDINPQAPAHILVIPKLHIASTLELNNDNSQYLQAVTQMANAIAKNEDLSDQGFRWVINTGKYGGQTVDHLHLHILGGRQLNWPPG
ncbi:MAG: histidine triad nucleotide-binding protein [Candidatus Marinimicrobia bacterium]|jgi:histidine triad (HIT) family protein|nr:histidine triad nucleotide-binding protein [Candidatus Neomarinimicrobiota bacterium]